MPLDGSASYEDIAAYVCLPRNVVYRLLQHAFTLRIFASAGPGRVQHNSRSAALARSSGLKALVSSILDDAGAPVMVLNEALRRYSRGKPQLTQKMEETSFALYQAGGQFGGFRNSWDMLENDGEGERKGWRQRNFVEFMEYLKDLFHLEGVVLNYAGWPSEGKATVVDVSATHPLARETADINQLVFRLVDLQATMLSYLQRNIPRWRL